MHLSKIDPKFRQIVDLFFFTTQSVNIEKIEELLRDEIYFLYFLGKFIISAEMFWEDGEIFWKKKISQLLSLNNKKISKRIEKFFFSRMTHLIKICSPKSEVSLEHDVEYQQFYAYCQVKAERKDNLFTIKKYFLELVNFTKHHHLLNIVEKFIPAIFKDFDEYATLVAWRIPKSVGNFPLLQTLIARGIHFNKNSLIDLGEKILSKKLFDKKYRLAFWEILTDADVLAGLKLRYNSVLKRNLLELLENCEYHELGENYLQNMKNLVILDPEISNEVAIFYVKKLYTCYTVHKKANSDKLLRLLHQIPEISPKKILVYLSSENKRTEIKYIMEKFPELKNLGAFI